MRTTGRLGFSLRGLAWALLVPLSACWASPPATLDELKKLEIICFVPSFLPDGFKLQEVAVTYDEPSESEDKEHPWPLYSVIYKDSHDATFSIESAREGIGDRNLMATEDADESEIPSPLGPMDLIYTPKGKEGRKAEIIANWESDANMTAETAKGLAHPVLGRFHGFSATGITVAEFSKIIQSLHPIRSKEVVVPPGSPAPRATLRIHPKVFSMIDCWISDSEAPVVTEINLDAVEKNGNQFNQDEVGQDGEWIRCPVPETNGFMRYRQLEGNRDRYKVEYQENGGGTLTTATVIEFSIEKRKVGRDGEQGSIRVIRVSSCRRK